MRNSSPRPALFVWIFLSWSALYGGRLPVQAGQVNITVDDVDPSIVYLPAAAWVPSSNTSCDFCLEPPSASIAFEGTWHHGLHIIPTTDSDDQADDEDSQSSHSGKGKVQARSRGLGVKGDRRDADDGTYDVNSNGATASPFTVFRLDSDDPGFVDRPVSLQFKFTGSAIYLYCLLPLRIPPNTNSTPTLTNLTFTLDGQAAGTFLHNGSADASGFQPNTVVWSMVALIETLHTLEVNLGPNSVFMFDYYVFTQADGVDNSPNATSTGLLSTPSSSSSESSPVKSTSKKSNVGTFAGVVGGSVGVLGTIAACLAFSIYRRRQLSAKRQRQERRHPSNDADSFHTDASEDGPPMQGPAPFVPRFFPGTVPVAPPPYVGPFPSPSPALPETTPLSYAERPPPLAFPSPSLPTVSLLATEDLERGDVPPPFIVAISSPEPPILASVMRQPIIRRPPPRIEDDEALGPTPDYAVSIRPSARGSPPPSLRSGRSIRASLHSTRETDAVPSNSDADPLSQGDDRDGGP
ncbi:hypothetical protein BV25DRAFT_985255 [Artomyces pyxidatus]|uniref:Uncharacterized protein n=1 Tax=Artomyces pyxidatus TaxID=48021 RepID=A0ACB8SW43_9AGAM|nr:hypothetical protein BV25DRAFT_985255 [Artomyces pyxidatus]